MAIAEIRPESEVTSILRRAHPTATTARRSGSRSRAISPPSTPDWRRKRLREDLAGRERPARRRVPLRGVPGGRAPDRQARPARAGDIHDEYRNDSGLVQLRRLHPGGRRVGRSARRGVPRYDREGDVFVLGGDHFEYRYRRGSKVYVDHTSARPTVPSWYSERLPLSSDLAREILAFQGDLLTHYEDGGSPRVRAWLREFPLDDDSVRAISASSSTSSSTLAPRA